MNVVRFLIFTFVCIGIFEAFGQQEAADSELSSVLKEEKLYYLTFDDLLNGRGIDSVENMSEVWGYSEGNKLFVKTIAVYGAFDSKYISFQEITFLGELSIIVFGQDRSYRTDYGYVSKKIQHKKILDLRDGKAYDATLDNLELLISNDVELLNEFRKSKEKDEEIKLYLFIRKYNERHPVQK